MSQLEIEITNLKKSNDLRYFSTPKHPSKQENQSLWPPHKKVLKPKIKIYHLLFIFQ